MTDASAKPRIAVHKFSSCDGCQLALLNSMPAVLALADRIDIVHFAEAGPNDPDAEVDVALIEGSVATAHDVERIREIRKNSKYLVSIGACATSGGLQALRNRANHDAWRAAIYPNAEYIDSLAESNPIAAHVRVDRELHGCPVDSIQLLQLIQALLLGGQAEPEHDNVCTECKRRGNTCVLVTREMPCLGPVTRAGCGAICPSFGRDCYGCFGPADHTNTAALTARFRALGLSEAEIADRFLAINNQAPAFRDAGLARR